MRAADCVGANRARMQENKLSQQSVDAKKTAWDYCLWATLVFLLLMLLTNLTMAIIALFAIPHQIESRIYHIKDLRETRIRYTYSPHDPSSMNLKQVVSKQAALIKELRAENAELKAKIAALEKNSSNSSKPPSSDIVKPPKPKQDKERRKRKIGAQKGLRQEVREGTKDTFVVSQPLR